MSVPIELRLQFWHDEYGTTSTTNENDHEEDDKKDEKNDEKDNEKDDGHRDDDIATDMEDQESTSSSESNC